MATQQELDDLDDLDDILDDFDSGAAGSSTVVPPSKSTSTKPPPPSLASASQSNSAPELDLTDDDFARQLQLGMEQLMRDMESNPSTRTDFETLVKQMSSATAPVTATQGPSTTGGASSFSETLSRTMERMQESEQQAGEAQSTEGLAESETDVFLAEMLKQLDAAGGGDGGGGEMGMAKLLEGMMEQLMSKEILYEPMKDLNEKYPEWLKENKEKLSKAEYEGYEMQYSYVKQVMTKFDDPKYDDEDKASKAELVETMQKMQELGPPPKEIMSEMAPGMELDGDGLPVALGGEQCCVM